MQVISDQQAFHTKNETGTVHVRKIMNLRNLFNHVRFITESI